MDVILLLDDTFGWTLKRITGVSADRLGAPTPCADWTLRALLNHTYGTLERFTAGMEGETDRPSRFRPDLAATQDLIGGDDPVPAFTTLFDRAVAAWHAPGAMGRSCVTAFGPTPAPLVAQMNLIEALVHGWDVGRATGEQADIPAHLAEPALEIAREAVARLGRGRAFGPQTAGAADGALAIPSDRLVAYLGRTP